MGRERAGKREGTSPPRLFCASSEQASQLASDLVGKVALCVTSPPYHNAISYTSHQEDREANYRVRSQIDYAEDYLSLLHRVWMECFTMLRPGGYLAVNVGTVLDGGRHYPLPQDITQQLIDAKVDWVFVRSIQWNKVTAGVKRAGSVIQHRLPGYYYANLMTEHIIIVRKGGLQRGQRPVMNRDVPGEWWENIWDLAPVPPRSVDHPAPFPEDLPHRLIRMLTHEGDVVLDPFNGAGASTKAAFDLGRVGVGFDLSEQYVEMAAKRIHVSSAVRPRQIVVHPVPVSDFTPGKSRGRTRHGAGLSARRSVRGS